jgi:NitT/TauT family transport system substrate-binding protein
MHRLARTGLIVFAAVIVVGAGLWISRRRVPSAFPAEKIVLGAETIPFSAPVWIAEHNGYFHEEGVEVDIRGFDSGRTALFTMVEKGGLDVVTAAQTPVVSKSFDRNDYAIVAGLGYSDKDVKLLARRDRGINSPSDLKGKTIGITKGSSGHFFLSLFLAYYQLQLSDVKTTDFEATQLGDQLIEGHVDAIATWEPHIYKTRKFLGEKAKLLPGSNIYREDFYFIARKEFINRHPQALERFLRGIEKAQQFIRTQRAATLDIVQRRLQIDPEVLRATWDQFRFELSLDQSILVSLEDEARWAIDNKFTEVTRMPNYLDYIYPKTLLTVKPEAVTIAGRRQ